jgi:membrane-associated PAP2 superfamily phosphatase
LALLLMMLPGSRGQDTASLHAQPDLIAAVVCLDDPQTGFIGRHSWFLEDILHDRAKQAVITIGVLAIVGFVLSLLVGRWRTWRRPLGYLVLAMGLSTSYVTPVKNLTGVHCPWSLSEFGGEETYTPLLSSRAANERPGHCWPGGHAGAGFALFALFFVLRDRRPGLAKAALIVALTLGITFSVGRMLQGAHFFSHNLWTALFDWLISLGCYRLVLYRLPLPSALRLRVQADTGTATD